MARRTDTVAYCLDQVKCNIQMAASNRLSAKQHGNCPLSTLMLTQSDAFVALAMNYLDKAQLLRERTQALIKREELAAEIAALQVRSVALVASMHRH